MGGQLSTQLHDLQGSALSEIHTLSGRFEDTTQVPVVVLGGMLMGVGLFFLCHLFCCRRAHQRREKGGVLPVRASQAKNRAKQAKGDKHGHTRLSTCDEDSD